MWNDFLIIWTEATSEGKELYKSEMLFNNIESAQSKFNKLLGNEYNVRIKRYERIYLYMIDEFRNTTLIKAKSI